MDICAQGRISELKTDEKKLPQMYRRSVSHGFIGKVYQTFTSQKLKMGGRGNEGEGEGIKAVLNFSQDFQMVTISFCHPSLEKLPKNEKIPLFIHLCF